MSHNIARLLSLVLSRVNLLLLLLARRWLNMHPLILYLLLFEFLEGVHVCSN
jgi:hypothetical protein